MAIALTPGGPLYTSPREVHRACNHRPPQGRVPVIRHGGHASGSSRHRPACPSSPVRAAARPRPRCRPGRGHARRAGAVLRAGRHEPGHPLRRRRPPEQAELVEPSRGALAARRPGRRDQGRQGRSLEDEMRRVGRRPQVVSGRQRQRQGGLQAVRPEGRVRRPEPVRRRLRPAPGRLRRRSAADGHAHLVKDEDQAAGRRPGHRVRHGLRWQLDRRLRRALARQQLVPDHEDRHPERVVDVRGQGALRGAWPPAVHGRRDPRAARHVGLHRGHRRQPLAEHDPVARRGRGRPARSSRS